MIPILFLNIGQQVWFKNALFLYGSDRNEIDPVFKLKLPPGFLFS